MYRISNNPVLMRLYFIQAKQIPLIFIITKYILLKNGGQNGQDHGCTAKENKKVMYARIIAAFTSLFYHQA